MRPVVWISDAGLRAACERALVGMSEHIEVDSVKDFLEQTSGNQTISFVDHETLGVLAKINHVPLPSMIVGICNETLPTAVGWLTPNPWLSHVIGRTMLEHAFAPELVTNLAKTVESGKAPRLLDWLGSNVDGRRIRLTHASRRVARLERMSEFFESRKVSPRINQQLHDAAEELLTNAFYDAPVNAGANPISRTQDVSLPDKNACDFAYGCTDQIALVRVRDPFGTLSRRRLVEVLVRCASPNMSVKVDESMGGAGLGMWRIFTNASFVAISVVKERHTEILVGITKQKANPRPFAFHLFFTEGGKRRFWQFGDDNTVRGNDLNQSVLLKIESK